MQEVIEAALNTNVRANTFHPQDVKTAILLPAGNNPSGTTAIPGPVTTTNHIKVPVRPRPVKTVAHLCSKRSSDVMIAITQRPHLQCRNTATRHRHRILRQRHHPPILFASNTVQPVTAIIMMITDGVVEEEELATEVATEEIIIAVRLSFIGVENRFEIRKL